MTTTNPDQTGLPQVAVNDIGSEEEFLAAIDAVSYTHLTLPTN